MFQHRSSDNVFDLSYVTVFQHLATTKGPIALSAAAVETLVQPWQTQRVISQAVSHVYEQQAVIGVAVPVQVTIHAQGSAK